MREHGDRESELAEFETDGAKAFGTAGARPPQELIAFSLRCARTANGLSHYYMYGDLAPEESLL